MCSIPCLQEYERRFLVWLDNMEYAQAHNEKQSSFKVHYRCIADVSMLCDPACDTVLSLVFTASCIAE